MITEVSSIYSLLQQTLRTFLLLIPYTLPHAFMSSKKLSEVRSARLKPPHHLKYRHCRGRPQVNYFVRQPLHSQKINSLCPIISYTHNSWILYKMKSPSAPFPRNMTPRPKGSRTSSPIFNPSNKIGSPIKRKSS